MMAVCGGMLKRKEKFPVKIIGILKLLSSKFTN